MKNRYWHLIAVGLFLLISVVYFAPIVFEGKGLGQHDTRTGYGYFKDADDYKAKTGKNTVWDDRMFSGQSVNSLPSVNIFGSIFNAASFIIFGDGARNVGALLWYMLGFYILMIVLGCHPLTGILGSIAYGLASYNLIIIDAGHLNKVWVMDTIAPLLAGIILCFRGKYLWGMLLTLLFAGINIAFGHQQITYYTLLIVAILSVVYFVYTLLERLGKISAKEYTVNLQCEKLNGKKSLKRYVMAVAILLVTAGVSFLPSVGSWLPTYDYSKETMRGGAVLKDGPDGQKEQETGLAIDYAFQWSSGGMENFTLLVPGLYGGSSNYTVSKDAQTYKATGQRVMPIYWGDMPFTSGPFYAGAIICMLFILGLFVVKGPEKWWLLIATVLSIMLGMGKNLMWFNEFMFNNLPLYNKFRVPSMALIIAGITMPVMAALALKEVLQTFAGKPAPETVALRQKYTKDLYCAAGITGGICLLFVLFGSSLFSFIAPEDARYPEWLQKALITDRASLASSDSLRSLVFILLGAGMLLLYIKGKVKSLMVGLVLAALVLVDMWGVDKRFLNDSHFVSAKKARTPVPTDADRLIMQDTSRYRVFNAAVSTFNDASTSNFHNSIGGYSAIKLRRYQDIIDFHFASRTHGINVKVLNMLNAKYFIAPDGNNSQQVQRNVSALGNAWFVDTLMIVDDPDKEIRALYDINPAYTAVVDGSLWKDVIGDFPPVVQRNDSAVINLVSYNLTDLTYESNSDAERVAVFSEVFYKTWKAYIDGVEVPIFRTNYILRGLKIPAGKHRIEFKCRYELAEKASAFSLYASIFVGLVLCGLIVGLVVINKRKKQIEQ
ncbi:MAG: YfhO family protein [Bacteroidales bacterium]|jgi:hypothetical protein|nr:YfhO family protein [Bacteroidales bacterium]